MDETRSCAPSTADYLYYLPFHWPWAVTTNHCLNNPRCCNIPVNFTLSSRVPFYFALFLAGSVLFPDVTLFHFAYKSPWLRCRQSAVFINVQRTADVKLKMAKILSLIVCSFLVAGAMAADKFVGTISGGFSPANVDDSRVQEIAAFATTAVASNTNTGPLQLVKVLSAETQVVAGLNYRLKLEFARKNAVGGSIVCDVTVWDQSWTNTRKLTESKCAPLLAKH